MSDPIACVSCGTTQGDLFCLPEWNMNDMCESCGRRDYPKEFTAAFGKTRPRR